MKTRVNILILMAALLLGNMLYAQQILLVEKPGTFRNYKYFPGDDIIVKTLPYGIKHKGMISFMTDSSIVINYDNEIMLSDIERILRPRWGLGLASKSTRIAGVGYLVIDAVNNTINNETIIDQNTVITAASFVAFSYALVPFHNKRIKIGKPWRIKVLDMSMKGPLTNPFQR